MTEQGPLGCLDKHARNYSIGEAEASRLFQRQFMLTWHTHAQFPINSACVANFIPVLMEILLLSYLLSADLFRAHASHMLRVTTISFVNLPFFVRIVAASKTFSLLLRSDCAAPQAGHASFSVSTSGRSGTSGKELPTFPQPD